MHLSGFVKSPVNKSWEVGGEQLDYFVIEGHTRRLFGRRPKRRSSVHTGTLSRYRDARSVARGGLAFKR